MASDKPGPSKSLKRLLQQTQQANQALMEVVQGPWLASIEEFRNLSRPVRRRSHYPTMASMETAQKQLEAAAEKVLVLSEQLNIALDALKQARKREG